MTCIVLDGPIRLALATSHDMTTHDKQRIIYLNCDAPSPLGSRPVRKHFAYRSNGLDLC